MPPSPEQPRTPAALSHIGDDARARMVDVSQKPITARTATAEGFVTVSSELAQRISENSLAKGSLLDTARLAGIMAAKRVDQLIPLCHTLPLDAVDIALALELGGSGGVGAGARVRVTATVHTHARTGVEMEALTAVSVACLTIIDMGKAVDKAMAITSIRVLEKHGGRSGDYVATDHTRAANNA
jgi:cyclic pyranopterin phosphate synthase